VGVAGEVIISSSSLTGAALTGSGFAARRSDSHATSARSVLRVASSSTIASASPAPLSTLRPSRSASSPMISMRLIESMLRSASRSRSTPSV
jgi:hypothetical protein